MSDIAVADTVLEQTAADPTAEPAAHTPPVLSDLLVEDVSIDGMCGVY